MKPKALTLGSCAVSTVSPHDIRALKLASVSSLLSCGGLFEKIHLSVHLHYHAFRRRFSGLWTDFIVTWHQIPDYVPEIPYETSIAKPSDLSCLLCIFEVGFQSSSGMLCDPQSSRSFSSFSPTSRGPAISLVPGFPPRPTNSS